MGETSSDNPTVPSEDRRATSETGARPSVGGGTSQGEVKAQVRDIAERASREAKGMIEQQKGAVAESLSSVSRALRSTADQLSSEQQSSYANYASSIASSIDRVSSSIRDRDLDGIKRDAESFARARPALFLGGCVALGFAISRFLKASGERAGEGGEMSPGSRAMPGMPGEASSSGVSAPPSPSASGPMGASAATSIESTGDMSTGDISGGGAAYFPEEREP